MDIKSTEAAAEAILFASGEPVELERLAQALEVDKSTVQKILHNMAERINGGSGGLQLLHIDDAWQLATRAEYAPAVKRALDIRRNMPLSPAAMEVLSIIAYNQPVTRGYIEQVRGVDSSGIVASLCSKGLVEERGRLDVPGRPVLYGTTLDFLRCFGLKSLNDLPEIEQLPEAESEAAAGELLSDAETEQNASQSESEQLPAGEPA